MTSGYCVNTIKYSVSFGALRYVSVMCDNVLDANIATCRTPIAENTAKKMFVKCTSFGLNAPLIVTIIRNGVILTPLTVAVNAVGTFTITADVAFNDGDDICIQIDSQDADAGTPAVIRITTCFLLP